VAVIQQLLNLGLGVPLFHPVGLAVFVGLFESLLQPRVWLLRLW
jgi:hypothetical protein